MNRRNMVVAIGTLTTLGFASAAWLYKRSADSQPQEAALPLPVVSALVRPHSPVLGPVDAPVTIVEFFDPSCESCRAFFPLVKQTLAKYPKDVRLVVRYVLFHSGSEEAARLLETARMQGIYEPVLQAVLTAQPEWHDDPKAKKAWDAAAAVGLNVEKAREMMHSPEISMVLEKDADDVKTVGIKGTPTFFVNGQPLKQFGAEPFVALVESQVRKGRTAL